MEIEPPTFFPSYQDTNFDFEEKILPIEFDGDFDEFSFEELNYDNMYVPDKHSDTPPPLESLDEDVIMEAQRPGEKKMEEGDGEVLFASKEEFTFGEDSVNERQDMEISPSTGQAFDENDSVLLSADAAKEAADIEERGDLPFEAELRESIKEETQRGKDAPESLELPLDSRLKKVRRETMPNKSIAEFFKETKNRKNFESRISEYERQFHIISERDDKRKSIFKNPYQKYETQRTFEGKGRKRRRTTKGAMSVGD